MVKSVRSSVNTAQDVVTDNKDKDSEEKYLELRGTFYHLAFYAFYVDTTEAQDQEILRILKGEKQVDDDLNALLLRSSTIQNMH